MLFSGQTFSGGPLSAGGSSSGDPRTIIAPKLAAGGLARFDVDVEFGLALIPLANGALIAPLVRRRETSAMFNGLMSLGANTEVSPVMATLDAGGGMTVAMGYAQARVGGALAAGGEMDVEAGVHRRMRARTAAGGGLVATLYEEHKLRADFDAGGSAVFFAGRWTPLGAVFAAEGGMEAATDFDLFGPVIVVSAADEPLIVVTAAGAQEVVATAADIGDIVVVSEGI